MLKNYRQKDNVITQGNEPYSILKKRKDIVINKIHLKIKELKPAQAAILLDRLTEVLNE